MSVAAKMPLIKIEITEGKKRNLYLVPKSAANAFETLLRSFDQSSRSEDFVDADELYPDLKDLVKGPAASFHGIRLRYGLTQKQMAEKIGITQSDVSKIEKGERRIGKKLALRIGRALGVEYKRFL